MSMNALEQISWENIEEMNGYLCARKQADHGYNREGKSAAMELFAGAKARGHLSLHETVDLLRQLHRTSPFLNYNGGTFSMLGEQLLLKYCPDKARDQAVRGMVRHHIAGTCILAPGELAKLLPSGNEQQAEEQPRHMLSELLECLRAGRVSMDEAFAEATRILNLPDAVAENVRALTEFELRGVLAGKRPATGFLEQLAGRMANKAGHGEKQVFPAKIAE